MSHNILHRDYPENCDRRQVKADMDHYVSMEDWQEGCSGLYNPIRWLDSEAICKSYDEAEELIKRLDRGDYDNLAVRYYVRAEAPASVALKKASEAVNNAQIAYNKLKKKVREDFFSTKSAFITCKNCESRLSKKYLKEGSFGTNCPLCQRNLLSDTATTRLMNAHDKIVSAEEKRRKELEKSRSKSKVTREVRWLVKVEYHT